MFKGTPEITAQSLDRWAAVKQLSKRLYSLFFSCNICSIICIKVIVLNS